MSRNSPFGVHVGQKLDSRAHLTGAIDDVRVYDRALSDGELADLRTPGASVTGNTVLWLPMDRVGASH